MIFSPSPASCWNPPCRPASSGLRFAADPVAKARFEQLLATLPPPPADK